MPMQLGDVPKTDADISDLKDWVDFRPNTSIQQGVQQFVDWYTAFF